MKTMIAIACLALAGCSMSVGLGFRKTPMMPTQQQPDPLLALSPAHIEQIIDVIGLDRWVELAPYALREGEEATVGAWCDIEIR